MRFANLRYRQQRHQASILDVDDGVVLSVGNADVAATENCDESSSSKWMLLRRPSVLSLRARGMCELTRIVVTPSFVMRRICIVRRRITQMCIILGLPPPSSSSSSREKAVTPLSDG